MASAVASVVLQKIYGSNEEKYFHRWTDKLAENLLYCLVSLGKFKISSSHYRDREGNITPKL